MDPVDSGGSFGSPERREGTCGPGAGCEGQSGRAGSPGWDWRCRRSQRRGQGQWSMGQPHSLSLKSLADVLLGCPVSIHKPRTGPELGRPEPCCDSDRWPPHRSGGGKSFGNLWVAPRTAGGREALPAQPGSSPMPSPSSPRPQGHTRSFPECHRALGCVSIRCPLDQNVPTEG